MPHVRAEHDVVWVDLTGLPTRATAVQILAAAAAAGVPRARLGVSCVALAAEIAGRCGHPRATDDRPLLVVRRDHERRFLGAHPVESLASSAAAEGAWEPHVATLLLDLGVATCDELAGVSASAVEVRLGRPGVALWHLARARDDRRIFARCPRSRPSASLAWTEFELRDATQLVFAVNRLLGQVCDALARSGAQTHRLRLTITAARGAPLVRRLASARPTANRAVWARLVRADLERLDAGVLRHGIAALALDVEADEAAAGPQGDLFDAGFQSGASAESALARVLDRKDGEVVTYTAMRHPLPERRVERHVEQDPTSLDRRRVAERAPDVRPAETLALRVLDQPVPVTVTTGLAHGRTAPTAYRVRHPASVTAPSPRPRLPRAAEPVTIVAAAGPDRIVTGEEIGARVGRHYWQCATEDEQFVLLYCEHGDGAAESWYLHGWWD